MADKSRKGDHEFRLVDPDTQVAAKVDNSGRLQITSVAATPIDTTEVVQVAQGDVSSGSPQDTIYTITNGDTLNIQTLQAGAEENTTGGSKIELYEDPNGDLSTLNLIAAIYVNGNSSQDDISQSFEGDGTRRIVLRRTAIAGAAREVFGRWKGFEE